jgi:1,4-dihydroxy-2-naphthoate octaprenyltransferase
MHPTNSSIQPPPSSQISYLRRWLLAARPKTLPAAVAPVLIGCGVAIGAHGFQLGPAAAALAIALLLQVGANLVNDVGDFQQGTDTSERLGPLRVTQAGLLAPRQVWLGSAVVFGAAGLLGIYLALVSSWAVLLVGAACILGAVIYTSGPLPLSRVGLGEVFVFLFFGIVAVCGTAYVQLHGVPISAILGGCAAGVLIVNILVVNNVRDLLTDRKAGRKNIPVKYGRPAGEIEFLTMQAAAFLIPVGVWLTGTGSAWVMLSWLSLPLAVGLMRRFHATPAGRGLNLILAQTAQFALVYSALLAVGLALP